jgi:predicted enzyme related to lactoylglutathione lyase
VHGQGGGCIALVTAQLVVSFEGPASAAGLGGADARRGALIKRHGQHHPRKTAWPASPKKQPPQEEDMITSVSKVVVPVDDQERAKEFWTTRMDFELRRDESYGDERWIEVSPPDGAPVLVLSPRPGGEPRREVPDELPHSPVFFDCADIEATHRVLSERGVRFAMPPARQQFGWWSLFEDPDGTRYALGQWGRTPAAPATPPPDPELKRLEPLLGTWRTEGNTQDSVLGPGVPVRSTETFYWLEGGYFLVSTYETTFGSEPTQTGVNYLELRRGREAVRHHLLQQQRAV